MSDEPSLFWIERDRLESLLARAGVAPNRSVSRAATGGTEQAPRGVSTARLAPTSPSSSSSTLPPFGRSTAAAAPSAIAPFVPPRAASEDRLQALLDWLAETTDCSGAFVADSEGLSLVRRNLPDELIAAGAALVNLWDTLRASFNLPEEGSLTFDLTDDTALKLVPVNTEWGLMSLGIAIRSPHRPETSHNIRTAFESALEEQSDLDQQSALEEQGEP